MADAAERETVVVWFRNDLRTADNAALNAAAETGQPLVCIYVRDANCPARPTGAAQQWWLHHSLAALDSKLRLLGGKLVLKTGSTPGVLENAIAEANAGRVFWNRRYDPAVTGFDASIKISLRQRGLDVRTFDGQLLHEPTQVKTGAGNHFKVYTPFWRALNALPDPRPPHTAPVKLPDGSDRLVSERLEDWNLLPTNPDWAGGMKEEWTPGEDGAQARLDAFLNGAIDGYADDRNIPGHMWSPK